MLALHWLPDLLVCLRSAVEALLLLHVRQRIGGDRTCCCQLFTCLFASAAWLQALEKLSHDHPASLLRNGALVAVLSYVDFFQVGACMTGADVAFHSLVQAGPDLVPAGAFVSAIHAPICLKWYPAPNTRL